MTGGRLLLVGGGHAHLLVLEALALRRLQADAVTLVSADTRQVYSGMVPGFVAGRYTVGEISIDLVALARAAGAQFIEDQVVALEVTQHAARLTGGGTLPWDVASVAVGGSAAGGDLPGVAAHALKTKPIPRVLELIPALERAAARRGPEPLQVLVVGSGAAGVEMALAVRARLDLLGAARAVITMVDARPDLFAGRSPRGVELVERALARGEVTLRLGTPVEELGPDFARFAGGRVLPADVVLWSTGSEAPPLIRASGLPTDAKGYLLVDDTLQAAGVPGVYGAGDAVTLASARRTPKAGVYAVRQGPVLVHNLAWALRGGAGAPPRPYLPQPRFLALLNTGDGRAILSYGGFAAEGRWAMWLKDRIDRAFIRRLQRLHA